MSEQIGLVKRDDEYLLGAPSAQRSGDVLVGGVGRSANILQPEDQVGVSQRALSLAYHRASKQLSRTVYAGRIHEDQLVRIIIVYAQLQLARGLWFRANDGDFFAQEVVDERRLAYIRPADDGYITRSK